jgi:NitT/TauT family transport system substrate-binding protein
LKRIVKNQRTSGGSAIISRRSILAGAAAAIVTGARGHAQGLEKVTFRFNWSWVGNYAPIVLGYQRGYFKDLGIDLVIGQGKGSGSTVRQVGAKNDQFAWADMSAVIVAGAQAIPVEAIMAMAYSNLAIIWIEGRAELKSAKDLIGKKISATPGDGNTQMWPAVLAANNLKPGDVELVYMDGTAAIAALRSGRVDMMFGGASDQTVTLRTAGVPARATLFSQLGVPTLGSGIIVHPDTIKDRPDLCRKIVAGIQKCWREGLKEPEAAVQSLLKASETPLNEAVIREGLNVFTSLLTRKEPMGIVDPTDMQKSFELLKEHGGVRTELAATAFYTNEFVSTN